MYTIKECVLKVKRRVNKGDTDDYDNIGIFGIIEALNKAQINVVSKLYSQNNTYKRGFESNRKRIDDLKVLLNTEPKVLTVEKKKGYALTQSLPVDYLHYVRIVPNVSKGKCKDISLKAYQVEESNISTLLENSNTRPSFKWRETLVTLVGDRCKIWTNDEFEVKEAYLTYLRLPRKVDCEGYTNEKGITSTDIHPEFNDDVMEMIIDEASRIIKGDTQDSFGMQVSQSNMNNNE